MKAIDKEAEKANVIDNENEHTEEVAEKATAVENALSDDVIEEIPYDAEEATNDSDNKDEKKELEDPVEETEHDVVDDMNDKPVEGPLVTDVDDEVCSDAM